MSPKGTPLTDEQYAAIAWADPSESTIALSRRLGVDPRTVWACRERIARAWGWWCEISVVTCAECGKPLLTNPKGVSLRQRYVACQRVHDVQVRQAYSQRRAQRRQAEREAREATRARDRVAPEPIDAFRDYEPWSAEEDVRLLAEPMVSAPVLARELGRSPASISMRRSRLRRQVT
jgi:hypothetical protein